MTNHIEQMMKTAGVGFISQCKHGDEFPQNCDCDYSCEECSAQIKKYPDFTPAKQLELIKLILKAGYIDNIHQYYYEISKMFVFECRSLPELGTYNQWSTQNVNYESALAELALILINENELDKSEVKKILEE